MSVTDCRLWLVALWPVHLTLAYKCSYVIPREDDVITGVFLERKTGIRKRATYDNLRIHLHFDDSINRIPEESAKFIRTNLLPEAREFWQQALLVRPASAAIRLYRKCSKSQYFIRPYEKHQSCVEACRTVTKCGEVVVPDVHLYQCRYCNDSSPDSCSRTGPPDGRGVPHADFLLYVSAVHSKRCEGKDTVAYAAHCQQEKSLDRPIAGHVNLCPTAISTRERDREILFSTVKHEILHALGFSAGLYAFFRDEDGNPLTRRNDHGKPSVLNKKKGYFQWSNKVGKTIRRNSWWTRNGTMEHSVHMIVTPRVRAEAQHHFNCSELEGAELENQGHEGTAMTHWEKRVFENEAMTGTHTQNPVYSRLTLALMEDTGWYRANYGVAQPLHWGRGLGCDFALQSCGGWIDSRSKLGLSAAPFCTQVKATQSWLHAKTTCTDARDSVALCNLVKYQTDLPQQFQNYDELASVPVKDRGKYGGSVELADYCAYNQEFEWKSETHGNDRGDNNNSNNITKRDSRCELEENTPAVKSNAALETYGPNSRCFEQSKRWILRKCGYKRTYQHYGAGCYEYQCHGGRLWLDILNSTGLYICMFPGQPIHIKRIYAGWLHEGTIYCPSCEELCQDCLPQDRSSNFPIGDPRIAIPCRGALQHRSVASIYYHLTFLATFLTLVHNKL